MKWVKRIVLTVLAVIVVVVAGGALIAELVFHALRSSPRIFHDEVPELKGGVRVMVQMDKAEQMMHDVMLERAPTIPPYIIGPMLPYEVTVQTAPDFAASTIGVNLYINDRRFGPELAKVIPNRIGMTRNTGIEWEKGAMASPKRGELVLKGSVPLDKHTRDTIAARWGETKLGEPLPMEKTHFIEMRCDNRDGALYAFTSSLVALRVAQAGGKANLGQIMAQQNLDKYMRDISDIHIVGDLTPEGGMTLSFSVECAPDCLETTPRELQMLVDTGYAHIDSIVKTRSKVHVEGASVLEGLTVRGDYKTDDIRALAPIISSSAP